MSTCIQLYYPGQYAACNKASNAIAISILNLVMAVLVAQSLLRPCVCTVTPDLSETGFSETSFIQPFAVNPRHQVVYNLP